MARAIYNTVDGVSLREIPDLTNADPRVVRVFSVGICGSDLWLLDQGPSPYVLGHEVAGQAADGTLFAVYPFRDCGECDQCRGKNLHRCRRLFETGFGLGGSDGGMRDELCVPPDMRIALPPRVRPADGCLVEPLAVAVHALRRSGCASGQTVAVVGGGSLGLLIAAVAVRSSCEVTVVARHGHQLAAAEKLGANTAVRAEHDHVIDAAGSPSSVTDCEALCRPGGTITLVGIHDPVGVTAPALQLVLKEITVATAVGYTRGDFVAAADILAASPEIAAAVVTHRLPLSEAAEAFDIARSRAAGAIKIVIEP
jgi:2-desacetyl-2-hydroxyethyl bacteriochlorophyllide A dehydrogenase